MNTPQAKFILQGYRPDGADAADETFAGALAQARQDAELGQWLEKNTAFDRVISRKLAELNPPAGLREAILAGGQLTAMPDRAVESKSWWRQPLWMAVAACVALVGALSLINRAPAGAGLSTLSEFAVGDASSLHGHGYQGDLATRLQSKLSQPTTALSRLTEINFIALRENGCRTVRFQGRDMLEICFQREWTWFHCYIARREDFPTLAVALAPTLEEQGKATIASWADAAHLYVVVGRNRAGLEKIL